MTPAVRPDSVVYMTEVVCTDVPVQNMFKVASPQV